MAAPLAPLAAPATTPARLGDVCRPIPFTAAPGPFTAAHGLGLGLHGLGRVGKGVLLERPRHLGLLGAVVGHVDADALLEAFAQRRLDPRARADDVLAAGPHLEDGLGGRDAEVLEERGK